MDILRLLVRVSILALFSLAAIVVMTVLFGAQMRFDRLAEIEIKGLDAPNPAPARIVTVGGGSSAHAGEERRAMLDAHRNDNAPTAGGATSWNATASIPDAVRQVSDPVKTEPADDSQFALVRVSRPGAAPSIHRVPKER